MLWRCEVRDSRKHRRSTRLAVASCVLAVPSATLALLDLLTHPTFPLLSKTILYGSGALLCCVALVEIGHCFSGPISRWLALSRAVAHLHQDQAQDTLSYYTTAIREHVPLLDLSVREFARRANLPTWQAWALMRNPDILPRPELWRRIEDALFLPEGHFQRGNARGGSQFGAECMKARLNWYDQKGIAPVYLLFGTERLPDDPRRLATVLRRVEMPRRAKLNQPGIWR